MEEKKTFHQHSGVAGAVIIFFILLFVFAKWGPAINFSTTTQTKGDPFVVSGEGKVSVTPDIAKITLGIQESGSSLKQVQDSVNTKSIALTGVLKKLGISDSDIKTTNYNVYPQYDYTTPTQKIIGYQVTTTYEVTVKDFDKINDVIVAGTESGANMVGNISFDLDDSLKTKKTDEARALAVADAKTKADGLAKAAEITLGKIINVSENQNNNIVMPLALSAAGGGVETNKSVTQPNVQPGSTDIDVTVSLSYEVR
jgi:uncharacterized protein YggE